MRHPLNEIFEDFDIFGRAMKHFLCLLNPATNSISIELRVGGWPCRVRFEGQQGDIGDDALSRGKSRDRRKSCG